MEKKIEEIRSRLKTEIGMMLGELHSVAVHSGTEFFVVGMLQRVNSGALIVSAII